MPIIDVETRHRRRIARMEMDPSRMQDSEEPGTVLAGPSVDPAFSKTLDELVAIGRCGQQSNSPFFNAPDEWLVSNMRILQDLPQEERERFEQEASQVDRDAGIANSQGKAGTRAGPDVVVRLDNGGLAFFSQLGVARRPDLTQYFVDGFVRNRDASAFSEANQALFAQVFPYITRYMEDHFTSGDGIIQTDRQIGDAPQHCFHARQLVFGTQYLQIPYLWRQLTFDLPEGEYEKTPDILEISIPNWLHDLGLPENLKAMVTEHGLTRLVFKAPTRGLSLHLGFDYVGEHKMGPLTIAMFLVKQAKGLAVQAALSLARVRTLDGNMTTTALVTLGPSLHGKSTLTIMLELIDSQLAGILALPKDPEEGVYPMNDDIVLLQPLHEPIETMRNGKTIRISFGINGTENNLYAVPFGLTEQDDPITYDVLRGSKDNPNSQETLENVPVSLKTGVPNYLENPVRNMRMILSRSRLLVRKSVQDLLRAITNGQMVESVHAPMEHTDQVFWQGVMRQNTIIAPLSRLTIEQYVRGLMFGEAVQTGAAIGAIGTPYVEYFSDPFIIGLEDENANLMYSILQQMSGDGLQQAFYMFNTGGVGADRNEEASGARYRKIPRELTLMLQEALLRNAVKFSYDPSLGVDIAVAIVDSRGEEAIDLREQWMPRVIYGDEEYTRRVGVLKRKRYYGQHAQDKAGILRYTKVTGKLFDLHDIPVPSNERELSWLLSFYWHVDQAYNSLMELARHRSEGHLPVEEVLNLLQQVYEASVIQGLKLPGNSSSVLLVLGLDHKRTQPFAI
ncbi:hypothetical protein M1N24_00630 [Dehalococcoidia bacterium]|nr:hypothetical protein [Dehalococcoidia bacterium]